jgi:hypothetical protein
MSWNYGPWYWEVECQIMNIYIPREKYWSGEEYEVYHMLCQEQKYTAGFAGDGSCECWKSREDEL